MLKEILMRKDNSTSTLQVRQRRDSNELEPSRKWSTLPISEEKAIELLDEILRYEAQYVAEPLLELICGIAPSPVYDNNDDLVKRDLAGLAALTHTFNETRRARNELGAYLVQLKSAQWE
jgi:hypothetical protein